MQLNCWTHYSRNHEFIENESLEQKSVMWVKYKHNSSEISLISRIRTKSLIQDCIRKLHKTMCLLLQIAVGKSYVLSLEKRLSKNTIF